MSERRKVVVLGASGLVGSRVLEEARGRNDLRVIALGRREFPLPMGGRMELVVCDPARWGEAIADIAPETIVCAVGLPWQKATEDEEAFRAVDQDLVLATAKAARAAEVPHWIAVSAAGANRHAVDDRYLQIKGEVEDALIKLKFRRLDVLRPGVLRGPRSSDRGIGERLGVLASPVADLLKQGGLSQFRSIGAREVARAILQLAREKAAGRFIHDKDAIHRAARRLPPLEDETT